MPNYYLWILPAKQKVWLTGKSDPPEEAINLNPANTKQQKKMGGNKTFNNWPNAVTYASHTALKARYYLTIDWEYEPTAQNFNLFTDTADYDDNDHTPHF